MLAKSAIRHKVFIASAGTLCSSPGSKPDPRVRRLLKEAGIRLWFFKARKYRGSDFAEFDYILTMEKDNMDILLKDCPSEHRYKIIPVMHFSPEFELDDVPDPYFGSMKGFVHVEEMLLSALQGFLAEKLIPSLTY